MDSVVVSVGSAGTITGVGETLKAWTNDVRMVAVEPFESQALSGGFTGGHGIPEMGFGFIPKNYNAYVVESKRDSAPAGNSEPAQSYSNAGSNDFADLGDMSDDDLPF